MNAKIKNTNDLSATIKANEKLNKLRDKFLTKDERERIENTSDIFNINRDSIIFLILLNECGVTAEQLNNTYIKAAKIANEQSDKDLHFFYKLNAQCQELKEKGVDIEKLYKEG